MDFTIYRDIINSLADGVFVVDLDWKVRLFNEAAEQITGLSAEEVIGMNCWDVFHSSACDGQCVLKKSINQLSPLKNKQVFIIKNDGKKIPISISAAPLRNAKGEIIGGVETFRDLSTLYILQKELKKNYTLGDLIGKSKAMQRIFSILPDVAKSQSSVLIVGESGTGKEVLAKTIHNLSSRSKKPFVALNCAAIPEQLLESELFGYKKGAFTDASEDRAGKLDLANGGTLFLDEIGEMPLSVQAKLLRVLESKEYQPLGSIHTKKSDFRLLAATNRNLWEEVEKKNFRMDLFYRINVITLTLPPLRERRQDIPLFISYFLEKNRAMTGKKITSISEEALAYLMKYDYPGNIRELENIIEYAFVLGKGEVIYPRDLPPWILPNDITSSSQVLREDDIPITLDEALKTAVSRALQRNNYKRMATCRELKITKDRLRRLIAKYQISIPDGK
jgi:PAS domain S-box-containing protein